MMNQVFNFLNTVIPKKKQVYFFTTIIYKDNINAVLEEFLKHERSKGYKVILDFKDFNEYQGDNIKYVKHMSLKSIWSYFRSSYVIYDNGIYGSRSNPKQVTVNTWHGMGLKKIGYYATPEEKPEPTATHILAYSEFFRKTMSYAFGVPEDKVIIAGDPRSDYMFGKVCDLHLLGIDKKAYDNVIIWMPTYRSSSVAESGDDGALYEFGIPLINSSNIYALNDYLNKINILLVIKYHSLQDIMLPEDKLTNINFLTSEDIKETKEALYSFLPQFDALITDYSSIALNFLLLNKPICYVYDDYELYSSKRGFMFENAESMMPGFKAQNYEQFLGFFKDFNEGVDNYDEERKRANDLFNEYHDNRNSYRLLKEIGLLD